MLVISSLPDALWDASSTSTLSLWLFLQKDFFNLI